MLPFPLISIQTRYHSVLLINIILETADVFGCYATCVTVKIPPTVYSVVQCSLI